MNVTFVPAKCFTTGRYFQKVDTLVIHWVDGTLKDADAVFTTGIRQSSAHFGVEDENVHQYCKLADTAWQAGNWIVNLRSVGIEHSAQPGRDASDATYETSSQLIVQICRQLGLTPSRSLLKRHSDIVATSCPGTIDIDRLARRSVEIWNTPSLSGVDQPVSSNSVPAVLASAPLQPTLTHYQFNFNLSPGMVGEEVGKLQDRLIELGLVGDVAGMKAGRGTYGPRTTQAVVTFQLSHGVISHATDFGAGYFGPITRHAINNL